jgi:alpha-amylase
MQKAALQKLYELEKQIKNSRDAKLLADWRRLQCSDIFYYMCTKWFSDGDVHKYFNPHQSPYEAFVAFMNILNDLRQRADTLKVVAT